MMKMFWNISEMILWLLRSFQPNIPIVVKFYLWSTTSLWVMELQLRYLRKELTGSINALSIFPWSRWPMVSWRHANLWDKMSFVTSKLLLLNQNGIPKL
jgi:hypothetical protein